jgi:hypothetical protein
MGPMESRERLAALGQELARVHEWLRGEIAALISGDVTSDRPFAVRCVAFCDALTNHHRAEDATAFPAIAAEFPDLAPLLAQMQQDHEMIATIIQRVDAIAGESGARAELEGLASVMDSHFAWEERRIVDALDALEGDPREMFGL